MTPSRGPPPPGGSAAPSGAASRRPPVPPRAPLRRHDAFKMLRILILLLLLLMVAVTTCQDRYLTTRWHDPLYVAVYPIAADGSRATRQYLAALDAETYAPIDRFFAREAQRYHLGTNEPVKIRLRPELLDRPPALASDAGILATALWSLRLRYWAWRVSGHASEPDDIRIFILYHDPALTPTVPHSLGLAKGLIGVVYAFAAPEMNGANDVVIAHELLHTVGATDKYSAVNYAPRFPDGFGDPAQRPLYPQQWAELMAGRRMIGPDNWRQAAGLEEVVIGPATAREIRWPADRPADRGSQHAR